jgi:hypothetical protein
LRILPAVIRSFRHMFSAGENLQTVRADGIAEPAFSDQEGSINRYPPVWCPDPRSMRRFFLLGRDRGTVIFKGNEQPVFDPLQEGQGKIFFFIRFPLLPQGLKVPVSIHHHL